MCQLNTRDGSNAGFAITDCHGDVLKAGRLLLYVKRKCVVGRFEVFVSIFMQK